ncbi:20700_t:CDS:2 [Entrophospora sp. SA101]|nr:20700_t:CDS:2 [Entrophospora sp. SA101]
MQNIPENNINLKLMDLKLKKFPNIMLGINEKNFIQSFMLDKDISIPSLIRISTMHLVSLLRNL